MALTNGVKILANERKYAVGRKDFQRDGMPDAFVNVGVTEIHYS